MHRQLLRTEVLDMQRAARADLRHKKHAAYTAWSVEDARRGFTTSRPRVQKTSRRWLSDATCVTLALIVGIVFAASI